MDPLKEKFYQKSVALKADIKNILKDNGDKKVDEVTVEPLIGGMRSVRTRDGVIAPCAKPLCCSKRRWLPRARGQADAQGQHARACQGLALGLRAQEPRPDRLSARQRAHARPPTDGRVAYVHVFARATAT